MSSESQTFVGGFKNIFTSPLQTRADINVNSLSLGSLAGLPFDGTSDASVVIQNALNFGGLVQLPKGTFTLNSKLTISVAQTSLVGSGADTKLVAKNALNDDMILVSSANYVRIADMVIDGNIANQASGNGIKLLGANSCVLENVNIFNCKQAGIIADEDADLVDTTLLQVINCQVGNCGANGMQYNSGSADISHTGCFIGSNTGYGVYCNGSNGCSFVNCGISANTLNGFECVNGGKHQLINSSVDHNQGNGVVLAGSNDNSTVIGNKIFSNNLAASGSFAIALDNTCSNSIIADNVIFDDQGSPTQLTAIYVGASTVNNIINRNSISNATTPYNVASAAAEASNLLFRGNVVPEMNAVTGLFVNTLTPGVAQRNNSGYNLLLNICYTCVPSTSSVISIGVAPNAVPIMNPTFPAFTTPQDVTLCAVVPNGYYILVEATNAPTLESVSVQATALP